MIELYTVDPDRIIDEEISTTSSQSTLVRSPRKPLEPLVKIRPPGQVRSAEDFHRAADLAKSCCKVHSKPAVHAEDVYGFT